MRRWQVIILKTQSATSAILTSYDNLILIHAPFGKLQYIERPFDPRIAKPGGIAKAWGTPDECSIDHEVPWILFNYPTWVREVPMCLGISKLWGMWHCGRMGRINVVKWYGGSLLQNFALETWKILVVRISGGCGTWAATW
jgi:hypothetical protein